MRIEIDSTKALNALCAVVAEAGVDHVYTHRIQGDDEENAPSCRYVFDGSPDCITARALARLGVPVDALAKLDCTKSGVSALIGLGYDFEGMPYYISDPANLLAHADATALAARALQTAQSVQDNGGTWGAALEAALKVVSP